MNNFTKACFLLDVNFLLRMQSAHLLLLPKATNLQIVNYYRCNSISKQNLAGQTKVRPVATKTNLLCYATVAYSVFRFKLDCI